MSYLGPLRLHFSGTFQAAPSTVNNDPAHYNNATFRPELQERGNDKGWWNPRGDASWRLIGCNVTAAWRADGTPASQDDPARSLLVADSDSHVAAKLADLDPEQQMVSEVWGLEIRLCDAADATLLRGRFEPAPFTDIWRRAEQAGDPGDIAASAAYQSVLTHLEWGDVSGSPMLSELRVAAADDLLSIKFNVDGYNMDFRSPDFTRGRIAGTIGPAAAGEPRHFVRGRQFMADPVSTQGFFVPRGRLNFCAAVVDESLGKVYLDLGNALPAATPGGPPPDLGTLTLVAMQLPPAGSPQQLLIGTVDYRDPKWYETTAGVAALPADRRLSDAELQAVAQNPLILSAGPKVGVAESVGGWHVRADEFVLRVEPGAAADVRLYASRFGRPAAGARIIAFLDPAGLQTAGAPDPNPAVIDFPARVIADADGNATLAIGVGDPGNPRDVLDGAVYGVRPAIEDTLAWGTGYRFNPSDYISLLIWDGFRPDEPPTWHGSLQPIFQRYANLYPVMDRFLNLGSYDSVCNHRELLLLAFGLDAQDPNSMPATRDLSDSKRQAILRWLTDVGADGKPRLGTPSPTVAAEATEAATAAIPAAVAERGGKAAAASRRLVERHVRLRQAVTDAVERAAP